MSEPRTVVHQRHWSVGLDYTIVNGRVIHDHGQLSGDLPGAVLRGAGYRG